jgi:hypothetical protein
MPDKNIIFNDAHYGQKFLRQMFVSPLIYFVTQIRNTKTVTENVLPRCKEPISYCVIQMLSYVLLALSKDSFS